MRHALALFSWLSIGLVGCGKPAPTSDAGIDLGVTGSDDAGGIGDAGATRIGPATIDLTLDAGAFAPTAAHPSALVYVPSRFDPTPPLSLIVYLHGFDNCVDNIVRDAGAACTPGGPVRSAYALAAQLESSGKNALLLAPELDFDQATGDPGNLGSAGGLKALVAETLADLAPLLGTVTVADLGTLVLVSHSGGYQAAAAIATRGGLPVSELYLLDSLYGNSADFDAWVKSDLPGLAGATPRHRFADVYTSGGGTLANSQAMADRARGWALPDGGVLVDDRTTATWPEETYHHGLLFKLSGLSHDGVPRYYFGQLVQSSQLQAR